MSGLKRQIQLLLLSTLFMALAACRVVTVPFQWPSAQIAGAEPTVEVTAETADLTAAPEAAQDGAPPRLLAIPALGLELPIKTMGWVVTEENGQRTTAWIIPTDAIGWHANSAKTGAAGNLILSGHQALGDALFAPLALGDITVGQLVDITDENGKMFRYQVTEVSEPIPVLGATEDDTAMAKSYLQTSETPILTMMTGWPDFTTTHRIFAVAEYVGD